MIPSTKYRLLRRLIGPAAIALAVLTSTLSVAPGTTLAQDGSDLFDSSIVHQISVSYDSSEYDAMIADFRETGDKDWIGATVTIDGAVYQDVEMRLKGNSSLAGLGGRMTRGRGIPQPQASTAPDPVASPVTQEVVEASESEVPTASSGPTDTSGPRACGGPVLTIRVSGGGGGFGGASADAPERLPWLIRLDRKVDGQNHHGITDLVVRSNNSQTSLNEAVALELLEQSGLASQQAAPTSFSVNGGEPVLRLIIENPEDTWMAANFEGAGALYKAESTGDWSYRGDDPEAYDEVFDQEAGDEITDLAPLIEFLRFINEADAATFATELPERLDVDGLATYLAMMDLVDNFDDIDGPGNNAYLHWDAASGRFTIVPWDMNLAFGGRGERGGPGDFQPREGLDVEQPPEGFQPPQGCDPGQAPDGAGPRRVVGGFGRGNPLIDKFHANPELEALYQAKLTSLRTELLGSGVGQGILDRWADVLTRQAVGLVDAATITDEAAQIADSLATQ